ncbi:hypothetical protein DdX_04813 [Ditylenchus destructor]|uniref:Uncharacterized protein n=1 Tax=Ditylenchus destructor TaxID=166010 RepID=A0AAD4NBL2_9BILA|nr:hypothetical protein DdX_04813 [Ditylenchus destructor]
MRRETKNFLEKEELLTKQTFAQEWPVVYNLLQLAPKPACLIAHYGLRYDFRIILNELRRNYASLKIYPIPDDVYFIDSYLAFVDLEKEYHDSIKRAINEVARAKHCVFQGPHALRFLKSEEWSPAKRHRIDSNIFEQTCEGNWRFNDAFGDNYFRGKGNFKLRNIYKKIIGDDFNAHQAEADTEALLQVSMSYGKEFINYVDTHRAPFPNLDVNNIVIMKGQNNALVDL